MEWRDTIIDSLAGAIAGATYILSSQPFDTVKVRMQMIAENTSIAKTAYHILKDEGALSFYKGVVPPLLFSLPISSLSGKNANWRIGFVAGCYAGFWQSFLTSPSELFKIVFQMQLEYLPKKYTSLWGCIHDFIRQEGALSFFKGTLATMFRDVPQFGVYFLTYEYFKYVVAKGKEPTLIQQLLGGCLSGLTCILCSYPQDVIKTQIQNEITRPKELREFTSVNGDGGITKCVKKLHREGGWRGFWVGFNSCALYYIVASAAQLAGYEQAHKLLENVMMKRD